jgi:hypothetical protein
MNAISPRPEPRFLPTDRPAPAQSLVRALVAELLHVIAPEQQGTPEAIVVRSWPRDPIARAIVTKTAVPPMDTTMAGIRPTAVGDFVSGLQLQSAGAQLIEAGVKVSLDGIATVAIPRRTSNPGPTFVAEGGAVIVPQPALTTAVVGPTKKMAALECFTRELLEHSLPSVEMIVRTLMSEAAALALDAAIFSTTPADATRPAGILAPPLTATAPTAGGGLTAMTTDIANLVAAITTAGGGRQIMIFAPPAKAVSLAMQSPGFAQLGTIQVVPTPALAPATIVVIDPSGFISGFGPDVEISASHNAVLHMEDTSPLPIASPGSPNTVAAPTRSLFQTDSFALKLILKLAFVMRAPLVQYIATVSW